MRSDEFADLLESLSSQKKPVSVLSTHLRDELGGPLSKLSESSKELDLLAEFFRRFPNQQVDGALKEILDLIANDRTSTPKLLQRIESIRSNQGESIEAFWKDVKTKSAPDLKSLIKALGGSATTKPAALSMLEDYLQGKPLPAAKAPPSDSEKIEAAHNEFQAISDNLSSLDIDEIRAKFAPLRKQQKKILVGVAERIGQSFRGTKTEIENQLLGHLENLKGSRVQSELIEGAASNGHQTNDEEEPSQEALGSPVLDYTSVVE